jgi:hypothetical protein
MTQHGSTEDGNRSPDPLRYVASGPSPYTVEAEIDMLGRFASGARRHRGWRGVIARGLVLGMLALLVVPLVVGVVQLLGG